MSLNTFRKGQLVEIGATRLLVLQKLPDCRWQLQNTATGEWCAFAQDDLLDRFARNELSFIAGDKEDSPADTVAAKLACDRSAYPLPELVARARNREQYLKEIDRQQPISITRTRMEPLIDLVSERIKDDKPPGSRFGGITASG